MSDGVSKMNAEVFMVWKDNPVTYRIVSRNGSTFIVEQLSYDATYQEKWDTVAYAGKHGDPKWDWLQSFLKELYLRKSDGGE